MFASLKYKAFILCPLAINKLYTNAREQTKAMGKRNKA